MKLLVYDGVQWNEAQQYGPIYLNYDYLYTYNGSWPTQQDYPPQLIIYQYNSYSGWEQTY